MTSPIATPVRADPLNIFRVIETNGFVVAIAGTPEQRDELIRRINGWDGLVELAIRVADLGTSAYDESSQATHCFYCDTYSDKHEDDCIWIVAKTLTAAQSVPSVSEGV